MQQSQLANELRRRRSLSEEQRRAEFLKYLVPVLLCWAMALVFVGHLIDHVVKVPAWGLLDIPATLGTAALAVVLTVCSWLRYKDWRILSDR